MKQAFASVKRRDQGMYFKLSSGSSSSPNAWYYERVMLILYPGRRKSGQEETMSGSKLEKIYIAAIDELEEIGQDEDGAAARSVTHLFRCSTHAGGVDDTRLLKLKLADPQPLKRLCLRLKSIYRRGIRISPG